LPRTRLEIAGTIPNPFGRHRKIYSVTIEFSRFVQHRDLIMESALPPALDADAPVPFAKCRSRRATIDGVDLDFRVPACRALEAAG